MTDALLYKYYVIISGGRGFRIDLETYNICKALIQGDSEKIQSLSCETDDMHSELVSDEVTLKVKEIVAVERYIIRDEISNE